MKWETDLRAALINCYVYIVAKSGSNISLEKKLMGKKSHVTQIIAAFFSESKHHVVLISFID